MSEELREIKALRRDFINAMAGLNHELKMIKNELRKKNDPGIHDLDKYYFPEKLEEKNELDKIH